MTDRSAANQTLAVWFLTVRAASGPDTLAE